VGVTLLKVSYITKHSKQWHWTEIWSRDPMWTETKNNCAGEDLQWIIAALCSALVGSGSLTTNSPSNTSWIKPLHIIYRLRQLSPFLSKQSLYVRIGLPLTRSHFLRNIPYFLLKACKVFPRRMFKPSAHFTQFPFKAHYAFSFRYSCPITNVRISLSTIVRIVIYSIWNCNFLKCMGIVTKRFLYKHLSGK
jgi:hypothetical protein